MISLFSFWVLFRFGLIVNLIGTGVCVTEIDRAHEENGVGKDFVSSSLY